MDSELVATILRITGICLAMPCGALCFAFAWHLWIQGMDPKYRPVFHSAVYAYSGMAILSKAIALGLYLSLDFPYQWGLWPLLVGLTLLLYGMVCQIMLISRREW